jgi:hypothetical protein
MTSQTVVELLSALPNKLEAIATFSHTRLKRPTDVSHLACGKSATLLNVVTRFRSA